MLHLLKEEAANTSGPCCNALKNNPPSSNMEPIDVEVLCRQMECMAHCVACNEH